MNAFIDYSYPDAAFWRDYSLLWENSAGMPAFQSPHALRYFVEKTPKPVAVFKYYAAGRFRGAALFHKNGDTYGFLSDMKTDHNSFVIHKDCTETEIKAFFDGFHAAIKKEKWKIVLNNQPMWNPYMDVFVASGRSSSLFWLSSKSSVCPMVKCETPQALYERLSQSRNNRYKLNRLQREFTVDFEAIKGEEDLENWMNQFCDCHIARWSGTTTPSKYLDPERRVFLLNCLKAWNTDGILERFALKANGKRIAFIIGLKQENTLIYHNLTYDPDYHKHSPSLVLIHFLGAWMKNEGLCILDFGDGNEAYKYNFANEDGRLNSIFIAPSHNLPFIIKSNCISIVRNNPFLIQLYRHKLRPLTRLLFALT